MTVSWVSGYRPDRLAQLIEENTNRDESGNVSFGEFRFTEHFLVFKRPYHTSNPFNVKRQAVILLVNMFQQINILLLDNPLKWIFLNKIFP